MAVERITFPGHDGSELVARLDMPSGPHLATAVFAHCFTCGKDIPAARRIAARLAAMGIAVLRFDFTGLGHSEGEFEDTSFSSNVDDLIAAVTWAAQKGMPPSLLIGYSLGGAAVIKAASLLDGIKAVATIGAPYDPAHVTHHFADALPEIAQNGTAEVTLGGRPFTIGKSFIEDTGNGVLGDVLPALARPYW